MGRLTRDRGGGSGDRLFFSSRRRHTRSLRDWSSDCALPISVLESSSYIDTEVPLRVYAIKNKERAVRLTFLDHAELAGYWGIEETAWGDAPALQQPNFKHTIKGREYNFYFSGPHLHMIVLRDYGASYWVVNTLTDTLSNETMIAIAKGLK